MKTIIIACLVILLAVTIALSYYSDRNANRLAQLSAMGGVECGIQAMLLREGKQIDMVRSSAYACLNDHWKIIGYPKELYQTKEATK
jgi:hypothetical protein